MHMKISHDRLTEDRGQNEETVSGRKDSLAAKKPLLERLRDGTAKVLAIVGTASLLTGVGTCSSAGCGGVVADSDDNPRDTAEAESDEQPDVIDSEDQNELMPDADAEEAEAEDSVDLADEGNVELPDSEDVYEVEPEADSLDADVDETEAETEPDVPVDEGVAEIEAEADTAPDETVTEDGGEEVIVPLCPDVHPETVTGGVFMLGVPGVVGGYGISYDSRTATGGTFRITCDADSASIVDSIEIAVTSTATIERPEDGMAINITVNLRNYTGANLDVNVVNSP